MKIGNGIKNSLNSKNFKLVLLFLFSLLLNFCTNSSSQNVALIEGSTMGTSYSVKIVDTKVLNSEILKYQIDSILVLVNQQMSTYINDSELSKFNTSLDTNWIKVSEELCSVINDAINIGNESNGFYDVTIGPVVNLWGFGPDFKPYKIPSPEEIKFAEDKVGISKLKADVKNSTIKKNISDLYCDLSSIAKGFGVDKVALFIEEIGYTNYMVEIGGEVRTKGKNDKNENWKIGIPTPLGNTLQKIISISEVSVATSGDYLNYFEEDGIRYSHLIDPKIGKPISHNLASVTVIYENCRIADALATTINVMGPEIGYDFALKKKLPIFMIVRKDNKFIEKVTPQFEEYMYERD
ncbi:MAG: FAD:protein FMN transferase [Ignavibacteriae bacterium]|nr:FAD:protein FMN transferase [Ignavibacteriota bacterium]